MGNKSIWHNMSDAPDMSRVIVIMTKSGNDFTDLFNTYGLAKQDTILYDYYKNDSGNKWAYMDELLKATGGE